MSLPLVFGETPVWHETVLEENLIDHFDGLPDYLSKWIDSE